LWKNLYNCFTASMCALHFSPCHKHNSFRCSRPMVVVGFSFRFMCSYKNVVRRLIFNTVTTRIKHIYLYQDISTQLWSSIQILFSTNIDVYILSTGRLILWHMNPLLRNDRKTNETTVVVRQQPSSKKPSNVGSGVFYVVRSEAVSLDRPSNSAVGSVSSPCVEVGSNNSTVALRVVGGGEKGTQCWGGITGSPCSWGI
jgi:hypothetical protein